MAESVVGRQHAKGEIRRVKGDFQQFVAPEVDGVCLPLHELDEKRRCRIGRCGPQLRRRDERDVRAADEQVAGAGARHGDAEDGGAVVGLRVEERAVGRAGVEHVFEDGVGRAFGERERVQVSKRLLERRAGRVADRLVAGLERDACDAARERNVRRDPACGGDDA